MHKIITILIFLFLVTPVFGASADFTNGTFSPNSPTSKVYFRITGYTGTADVSLNDVDGNPTNFDGVTDSGLLGVSCTGYDLFSATWQRRNGCTFTGDNTIAFNIHTYDLTGNITLRLRINDASIDYYTSEIPLIPPTPTPIPLYDPGVKTVFGTSIDLMKNDYITVTTNILPIALAMLITIVLVPLLISFFRNTVNMPPGNDGITGSDAWLMQHPHMYNQTKLTQTKGVKPPDFN